MKNIGFIIVVLIMICLCSCFSTNRVIFPSGCYLQKHNQLKIVLYDKSGGYIIGPLVQAVMWTDKTVYGGYEDNAGIFGYFLYQANVNKLKIFRNSEDFDESLKQLNLPNISVKKERVFDRIVINDDGIAIDPQPEIGAK